MMIKRHNKSLLFLFILALAANAFAKLPTGQWQTHMSYVEGQRLAISESKVYVVASGSLFSYGLNDNSIETYTKINGLSDVYINDIAFCNTTETLIICYANGNIDLMNKDGITNVPDLYLKPIYGEKTINKVDIYNGIAYLSTAFGILNLNIAQAEISETYKLSDNDPNGVNGVAILNDDIYAATDNGLYKADLNHTNLQNFSNWELITSIGNQTMAVKGIVSFKNQIVATQYNDNDSYYYIKKQESETEWKQLSKITVFGSFGSNEDILLVANGSNIKQFDKDFTQQPNVSSYNFTDLEYSSQNKISVNHAIPIDDNSYYVADKYQGLVYYQTNTATQHFKPEGPATNTIWDMNIVKNVLRTVHGGTTTYYNNTWTPGAFSSYIDNKWTHLAKYNGGENFADYIGIITDPLDVEHFYISTYGRGVLEYQGEMLINRYTDDNSTIENAIPGNPRFIRTSGMAIDNENNLWINNSNTEHPLHVKTNDEKWYAFSSNLTEEKKAYSKLLITNNDVKWLSVPPFGYGILAYDDKGTFDDPSDDEDKYFDIYESDNTGSLEFISKTIYDFVLDKDGRIWVGNDNGVAIYNNPESVFNTTGTPEAYRVNIPRNDGTGLGDYLLDGTTVNSIAVDGGNRKWLATASTGVMLVSSDGQDVIHHFTKENSPLLDDNVHQVEVNQETGEVFFATEAGLISFQADASTGEDDFSNLKVYPNPVREDFYGDITITGLVDKTTVKITDVSGNLVRETTSNGGTAVWDGKNFYGERVGTGVYLFFCSDEAGERSGMTKVLVIN